MLVIGGANTQVGILAAVKIYDPTDGTLARADDISAVRVGHTATMLAYSRVLMVGGVVAIASVLSDGTVMIIGGSLRSSYEVSTLR